MDWCTHSLYLLDYWDIDAENHLAGRSSSPPFVQWFRAFVSKPPPFFPKRFSCVRGYLYFRCHLIIRCVPPLPPARHSLHPLNIHRASTPSSNNRHRKTLGKLFFQPCPFFCSEYASVFRTTYMARSTTKEAGLEVRIQLEWLRRSHLYSI